MDEAEDVAGEATDGSRMRAARRSAAGGAPSVPGPEGETPATAGRSARTAKRMAAPNAGRSPARARRKAGRARRPVRWSARREAAFLAALAESGNVLSATRVAGLSSGSVYRRRDTCEAFRAAWAAALREGYVRLETMLLGRAINGVRKPVWHGGKKVGSIVEYSDRLALALIAQHRAAVTGQAARPAATSEAEAQAILAERLGEINLRLGGAG